MRRILIDRARVLDISVASVERDWQGARALLYRTLPEQEADEA